MKNHNIHIAIPQPCHEAWENMDATQRGAFCHSCQTQVIDFSAMTDREVIEHLEKYKTACGRFRGDQVNKKLTVAQIKNGFLKWRAVVLSILSLGAVKAVMAALPHRADMSQYDEARRRPADSASKLQPDTSNLKQIQHLDEHINADSIEIQGTVLNEMGEKIKGAIIVLMDSMDSKMIVAAKSDSTGKFTLQIDKQTDKNRTLQLWSRYGDQRSKRTALNRDASQKVTLILDEYTPIMMGKIARY
jgi:hypothetical protein